MIGTPEAKFLLNPAVGGGVQSALLSKQRERAKRREQERRRKKALTNQVNMTSQMEVMQNFEQTIS
jgi:hypothetical protein